MISKAFHRIENMADNKKYLLDGYTFETEAGLQRAKLELSRINQVKKDYNLNDLAEMRRAYDLLINSGMFETPVGIGFLREMQKILARDPENRRTLRAIPAPRGATEDLEKFQRDLIAKKETVETYDTKLRNQHIVIIFLIAVVAALFLFTIFDRNIAPMLVKDQVTDQYSTWQEQIDEEKAELYEIAEQLKKEYPADADKINAIISKHSTDDNKIESSTEWENGKAEDSGG